MSMSGVTLCVSAAGEELEKGRVSRDSGNAEVLGPCLTRAKALVNRIRDDHVASSQVCRREGSHTQSMHYVGRIQAHLMHCADQCIF